jgi:hypothetical protein
MRDPNELAGPIDRGWPLDGVAADWILDLENGRYGDLQLRMGYGEVERLLSHKENSGGLMPRGPAAVRLRLNFEDDDDAEIPEDDDAEMEFATDIELDWSELLQPGPSIGRRPLIRLPGREPVACTTLTFADLKAALGEPTQAEIFDDVEDQWLFDWPRSGFYVTATTVCGMLGSTGIATLSLVGDDPPLSLVKA